MPSRREFVAAGAGLALGVPAARSSGAVRRATNQTIVFQGDSITDCGRDRTVTEANRAEALATGYPLLVASTLLRVRAGDGLRFLNRGVSGSRVPDLAGRWQRDVIDLKPDILSILIGVNDLSHRFFAGYRGTVQDYATGYRALLEQARAALPGVRLVVLEPFVLRTGVVTSAFFPEFDERRAVAQRVAHEAGATFIPLHERFERLARRTRPEHWADDGIHPTPAGHAVIAQAWLQAVSL